jgi:hypothetical protein
VIPSTAEIFEGYGFHARRHGLPSASERAVAAALEAARGFAAGNEADEPAALFFAFATYRRAFPGALRFMTRSIAAGHARGLGFRLRATSAETDEWISGIMFRTVSFEDVKRYFAERLVPLE